jgi:hypothetical protein
MVARSGSQRPQVASRERPRSAKAADPPRIRRGICQLRSVSQEAVCPMHRPEVRSQATVLNSSQEPRRSNFRARRCAVRARIKGQSPERAVRRRSGLRSEAMRARVCFWRLCDLPESHTTPAGLPFQGSRRAKPPTDAPAGPHRAPPGATPRRRKSARLRDASGALDSRLRGNDEGRQKTAANGMVAKRRPHLALELLGLDHIPRHTAQRL